MHQKKVIIIGASSGMGRELAKIMAAHNYIVGVAAPQEDLLISLQQEIPTTTHYRVLDVCHENARHILSDFIDHIGGVDIIVICAGIGPQNPDLLFDLDKQTIDVNVTGFCAMATISMHHFIQQKHGHLVVISSIAGIRGNYTAPAYNASKAFISNYLQGLRKKIARENWNINVTDIKPGFVDTIIVYVSPIWRLVAWGLYIAPDWIYNKFE